jgi:hypothetical protein
MRHNLITITLIIIGDTRVSSLHALMFLSLCRKATDDFLSNKERFGGMSARVLGRFSTGPGFDGQELEVQLQRGAWGYLLHLHVAVCVLWRHCTPPPPPEVVSAGCVWCCHCIVCRNAVEIK